jgi:hypothetical protein
MLAYGYKPSDLMQISALDVVDFFKGHRERLKMEIKLLFDAAEMAGLLATGNYRRPPKQEDVRTRYSDKTRELIEKADRKDREQGKIKVDG